MKKVIDINGVEYKIIENEKDAIDVELLKEKITDYFDCFDFIVGDWAYNKLRLKGFYKSEDKNCKNFNNINNVEEYLKEYCAYGCRYFILEKLKVEK